MTDQMPVQLGVSCDTPGDETSFVHDFLVPEDSTRGERLRVVLDYAAEQGWRVDLAQPIEASSTYCPRCAFQMFWLGRAEWLAERVRSDILSGLDALPVLSALEAALKIEAGELPASELDGYPFPDAEADTARCICPPDLLERGGFRGGCPVHSLLGEKA